MSLGFELGASKAEHLQQLPQLFPKLTSTYTTNLELPNSNQTSSNHNSSKMSDGQILKPDKDFTKEVDKQLPEAQELAKVGHVSSRP